jgi:hypothetical protein
VSHPRAIRLHPVGAFDQDISPTQWWPGPLRYPLPAENGFDAAGAENGWLATKSPASRHRSPAHDYNETSEMFISSQY